MGRWGGSRSFDRDAIGDSSGRKYIMIKATWLRVRMCGFEILEPRQVLSASFGLDTAAYPQAHALRPKASATPVGLGFTPAQLRQAYGFNNILLPGGIVGDGKGTTIAIVDAFNNPTIVSDVAAFSTQFGLQQFNVAGGPTFKVVNQRGSTILPQNATGFNASWALEIALDVEWAHAIAPKANILLVEATTNLFSDLLTAVTYARSAAGVVVVSNSYGGGEGLGEEALDFYYTSAANHVGVSFVVSAGDNGAPANWPSASPNVLSVGGTSLKLTNSNNWSSEVVWNNGTGAGGGGASQFENVPSFQQSLGLSRRGTPDVTYNGDPNTGVPVYSSFAFGAATPWEEIGGTSAGAPQWAALIAIADQGRALLGKNSLVNPQAALYKFSSSDFRDITSGQSGPFGAPATAGYDLSSGLGSPIANFVIRDLIAFNGSVSLPANRTPSVGGSNGQWYFFAKSMGSDGGDTVASAALSSAADDAALSIDNALASGRSTTASDYLPLPSDSVPIDTNATAKLALFLLDDGPVNSIRRGSIRHAAAAETCAAVDTAIALL